MTAAQRDGGLWVWVSERDGAFEPDAFGLLGKARELADGLGARVTALWLTAKGTDDAKRLTAMGADRVVKVASPHVAPPRLGIMARAASPFLQERGPDLLLLTDTPFHRALAARLAARLEAGCVAGVTGVELDTMERQLVFAVKAHGGRVTKRLVVKGAPALALVDPRAFRAPVPDEMRTGSVEDAVTDAREEHSRIRPKEPAEDAAGSDVVVCLGGVLDAAAAKKARELAKRLGARVAGDRHALERGHVTREETVGLGYANASARLWLSLGVWGALDHLAAVTAELTVAAHPDENAPALARADYALVGDAAKAVDGFLGTFR